MIYSDPIVVEEVFDVSSRIVWKAITNVVEMRHWFFDNIPDFKPEVGFATAFNVISGERSFMHHWKISEVEPLKSIAYDWSYADYPGEATVIFKLTEEDRHTRLSVTSLGMKSFPQDIPEFKRESCLAGWTYFIKGNLKAHLEDKI